MHRTTEASRPHRSTTSPTVRYLIALLVPPLYFALEGKWLAFAANGMLYGMACYSVFTMGIGAFFFFWLSAAVHALWQLRKAIMQEEVGPIRREIRRQSDSNSQ